MFTKNHLSISSRSDSKMKKGDNLETWLDEIKIWDKLIPEEERSAEKYLMFRNMIKEADSCSDLQKFVQVNIAEDSNFKKDAKDVIQKAVELIEKNLGKSDLEKSTVDWDQFMTIKQEVNEAPKDYDPKTSKVIYFDIYKYGE